MRRCVPRHVDVMTADATGAADQSDFEERERRAVCRGAGGFCAEPGVAVFLGGVGAQSDAAGGAPGRQVLHRDQLLGLAPPLAPEYAADEVGELAVALMPRWGASEGLSREQFCLPVMSATNCARRDGTASSCELLLENRAIDQRGRNQVERIARACEEMRELVQTS